MTQRLNLLHSFTIQDVRCLMPYSKIPASGTHEFSLTLCNRAGLFIEVSGDITIKGDRGVANLLYSFSGSQMHQRIGIVSTPSNIGNGRVWFFFCPFKGNRCRRLYLFKGYFMDRHNFDHLYKSQTLTPNQKNYLKISKAVEKHRLLNIVAVERDGRKFYYKDKPTKWFTPLLSARKFIEGIDVEAYKKSALKYDWVRYF